MWIPLAASLALAVVFAWAGVGKVVAPDRWRRDLQAYRLARPARAAGWLLVPWLELAVAVEIVAGWPRPAGGLALGLLAVFSAAIVRARIVVGSNQLACGCFGGHATRDYRVLLARNGALILLAAYVVAFPRAHFARAGEGLPLVLAGTMAVAGAAWVWWQVRVRFRERETETAGPT
jgi:hypothetical protein